MMRTVFCFFLLSILLSCATDRTIDTTTANSPLSSETTGGGMVVTANPHATEAGVAILEAGGSAIDAAVAIEAVLSLVEPQSSGLGGGGFLLYYDAETTEIDVYDGRERAPAGANPDMFLNSDGTTMGFIEAKNSGLSIGVPGMVSLLDLAHQDHGVLPWSALFDSGISLSEQGFEISPRLSGFLERFAEYVPDTADEGPTDAYEYFYNEDDSPKTRLVNPAYGQTLRAVREDADSFYSGDLAQQMVDAASAEPRAGKLALSDIDSFKAIKVEPLCSAYRDLTLCGPPPPSSWLAVGMVMGMLESAPRFEYSESSLQDWAIVGEALRLAYADRDQYVADTEFIDVPLTGLLDPEYLQQRASEIDPDTATTSLTFGDPWAFEPDRTAEYGLDATEDYAGTTHFSVVDAAGNVAVMTASVESIFGSTRMAGGMLLNNQLTDFSRTPRDEAGNLIANAVEPFKRPRSSMSPTIVLDADGEFLMSTGSPGGNSIISYTLKTLVAVIDWQLSPQEAIDLPNMVARGDTVRIESERASAELLQVLTDYGFNVQESAGENSGLSIILRQENGSLEGGVDPRREGTIGIPNY